MANSSLISSRDSEPVASGETEGRSEKGRDRQTTDVENVWHSEITKENQKRKFYFYLFLINRQEINSTLSVKTENY